MSGPTMDCDYEGRPRERLTVTSQLMAAVVQDARREFEKMVAMGWDEDAAAGAVIEWWTESVRCGVNRCPWPDAEWHDHDDWDGG